MLEVVLRPRAEADLAEIAQYTISEWGEAQAKRYIENLRRTIEAVADYPGMGGQAMGLPSEYRKVLSGSRRAIYRYTKTELIVVRVIHGSQDVPDDFEDFW